MLGKKKQAVAEGAEVTIGQPEKNWRIIWASLVANRGAMVGLFIILFLVMIAIIGPAITPHDPFAQDMSNTLAKPGGAYLMGTDQLGRDIFSRLIVGTRISLRVGVSAVAIAVSIGTILGSIAGYRGGRVDTLIMRCMDILLSVPSILMAITFMAAFGKGIDKAIIAIGLVSIPEYARIVRGSILSIKENDFVQAARVIGNHDRHIIFRHILPNVLSSIIVRATLGISTAVLDTAALGFLGLGVQPPLAEWGDMLGRSRSLIFTAPFTLVFPGLAITLTVLAFNLFGDGLRDALDPRSRK